MQRVIWCAKTTCIFNGQLFQYHIISQKRKQRKLSFIIYTRLTPVVKPILNPPFGILFMISCAHSTSYSDCTAIASLRPQTPPCKLLGGLAPLQLQSAREGRLGFRSSNISWSLHPSKIGWHHWAGPCLNSGDRGSHVTQDDVGWDGIFKPDFPSVTILWWDGWSRNIVESPNHMLKTRLLG